MADLGELVNAMSILARVGEFDPSQKRDESGKWSETGAGSGKKWKSAKTEMQSRIDKASPIKKMSDVIDPKEGQVYRIVTGDDYDDALKSGKLNPGKAADTGGTVNFSKEPIPAYAGSAFASHGLIVEVSENKFKNPDVYPGSKDLYIGSKHNVPLSDISRAWAVQYSPFRVVDVTDTIKGLSM